ncbi:MAG TPA: hypothetical protein VEL47_05995 [Myxococcota bacterium]|nr:hypothetical protein [Myxococcota bacterium]
MRQRLHIILTLLSCCFLYLMQSCTSDMSTDEQDHTEARDSSGEGEALIDREEDEEDELALPVEPVVAPVTPVAPEVPLPPPAPLAPWGGGGGGGGA